LGRGARSVLLVELHSAEPLTDDALGEIETSLEGGTFLDGPAGTRARAAFVRRLEEQRLSPEERVISLWRGEPASAAPTEGELRAFVATALGHTAARVVRPTSAN
jgi:hypothetical protein